MFTDITYIKQGDGTWAITHSESYEDVARLSSGVEEESACGGD